MFRNKLLWVGKTKETFLQEGILHYQKKLRPYLRLNCEHVHSSQHKKGGRNDSLREETQKILQRVDSTEQTIFLDEKGKGLSSKEFAAFLEQQMNSGISSLTFVIGGAYGFQSINNFYHFDTQGETIYRKRYALDLPRSMHDFSLNTDYAVFYLSPHVLDMTAMMQQPL